MARRGNGGGSTEQNGCWYSWWQTN
jgi:hypothetical protein